VSPRQLCNKLLHNCTVGPGFGKSPHIFEVEGGVAESIGNSR
jgi:hypothetical protein